MAIKIFIVILLHYPVTIKVLNHLLQNNDTYCFVHEAVIFQVKTSQEVSKVTRVPSLGYAETVEAVFATGPQQLRKASRASR